MKRLFFLIGVSLLFCLNSCLVSRKVVYFNDMSPDSAYWVAPIPPLKIQKNDRLSIQVSAKNPELAAPFNNQGGLFAMNEDGTVSNTYVERGYLVDQQGNIDFPILGTLKVEGMTLDGLRDFIKSQLEANRLISSPVVKVELMNLKVVVIGEAERNMVINAPDGRLTLLEAITSAGGLTNNSTPDKISVIREEGGQRKIYRNDIESLTFFDSPVYYLQQNDIVYIEPKASEPRGDEQRTWRIISMITSIIMAGTTIWAISTR